METKMNIMAPQMNIHTRNKARGNKTSFLAATVHVQFVLLSVHQESSELFGPLVSGKKILELGTRQRLLRGRRGRHNFSTNTRGEDQGDGAAKPDLDLQLQQEVLDYTARKEKEKLMTDQLLAEYQKRFGKNYAEAPGGTTTAEENISTTVTSTSTTETVTTTAHWARAWTARPAEEKEAPADAEVQPGLPLPGTGTTTSSTNNMLSDLRDQLGDLQLLAVNEVEQKMEAQTQLVAEELHRETDKLLEGMGILLDTVHTATDGLQADLLDKNNDLWHKIHHDVDHVVDRIWEESDSQHAHADAIQFPDGKAAQAGEGAWDAYYHGDELYKKTDHIHVDHDPREGKESGDGQKVVPVAQKLTTELPPRVKMR
ncbi:unnamed protein product [Amoebophrya sp. A120]|nr:unnamed protein product [Amoebophrya sp. A120]|eukprot:GSA120T00016065001.1